MTKKIDIKIYDRSNLESVIDLIQNSDHNNRDEISWLKNDMTAILAFENDKLIGAIPFENHLIKKDQNNFLDSLWVTAAYIKPSYRSKGIGTLMDSMIKKLYPEKRCVLVMRHDEGSLAYKWYKKNGYKVLSEVISLRMQVNDFILSSQNNYEIINDFEKINNISEKLLSSFNYYNNLFFNFPKRNLKSWTDRLKYHYYNKNYEYNIIINSSKNGLLNFALTGVTSIKDNILRVDILELSCMRNFSEFNKLIGSVIEFANLRSINEIRVQVALNDYLYKYFCKIGFSERWKTNLMIKSISNEVELTSLNTRFFQIDYI